MCVGIILSGTFNLVRRHNKTLFYALPTDVAGEHLCQWPPQKSISRTAVTLEGEGNIMHRQQPSLMSLGEGHAI